MTASPLTIESRGPIELITLNRPQSLNALNEALIAALCEYFERLHQRPDLRVILMRGAGKDFCAGADLKSGGIANQTVQELLRSQRAFGQVIRLMRSCPQPIIGLAQGAACGGGFSLLLACDVRYAAPSLRMNAAYIRIGLGGCDVGSSYFLPRLVGTSVAAEFLLTGRFMTAERAKATNLVSEVVAEESLLETGLSLASDMLATSPEGLRLTKEALNLAVDAPSLDAAMAIEDRQQILLTFTEDTREAALAFVAKRAPNFKDC